jgi:hypothetical protein
MSERADLAVWLKWRICREAFGHVLIKSHLSRETSLGLVCSGIVTRLGLNCCELA